ncbi:hypothetical protein [Exiguobacterium artemiae]|uniref:hypothetical protein n=1 Tax=Exiguobacterium artemiae TaxID=340145 RepID=UPI00047EDFA0|nr:hypothetical protein [Exiguobacterium sibiricum]
MMLRTSLTIVFTVLLSGCTNESANLYMKQSAQSTLEGELEQEKQWFEKAKLEGATDKHLIALSQQQEAFHDLEAAIYMNQTTNAVKFAERVMNQTFGDRSLANQASTYHRTLLKIEREFKDFQGTYTYTTSDQGEYEQDYSNATIDVSTYPNRKATLTLHDVLDYEGEPLDDFEYTGRFDSENSLMVYFYESSLEITFDEDGHLTFRDSGIEKDSTVDFEKSKNQSL